MKWFIQKGRKRNLPYFNKGEGISLGKSIGYNSERIMKLTNRIVELGERDGELLIQYLVYFERFFPFHNRQEYFPIIHSVLDNLAKELGFDNRFEIIQFYNIPEIDAKSEYNSNEDYTFDERISEVYSNVLKTIQKVRPGIQVTLPRISELVKAPKKYVEDVILAILEQKPSLGEYLQLEQVFIREIETDEIINDLIINPIPRYGQFNCYFCEALVEDRTIDICPNCGKDISRCIVCKLPISTNEGVGMCTNCEGLAHLNHLQEWVKVKGTCPSCLQPTNVEVIREATSLIRKEIFGINLSKLKIVNSREWEKFPEATTINDITGFFNMFDSSSDGKLLQWFITKNYNEVHYIGFFVQGKLFIHSLGAFDNLEDYLLGLELKIDDPNNLALYQLAVARGWPNHEEPGKIWVLLGKNDFEIRALIPEWDEMRYNADNIDFDILPPYEKTCKTGVGWVVWFYAYHNGWKSYKKLLEFGRKKIKNFDSLNKYERYTQRLLGYLAYHGPFKKNEDWLNGWKNFDEIMKFWDSRFSPDEEIIDEYEEDSDYERQSEVYDEIEEALSFPRIIQYNPDCRDDTDWTEWYFKTKKK